MRLLNGLIAPEGDGVIIEIHLDIMQTSPDFLAWLGTLGFADDPFLFFHPTGYQYHCTGRARSLPSELHEVLPRLSEVMASVIVKAREVGTRLYAEIELVRDIKHFDVDTAPRDFSALQGLHCSFAAANDLTKADIHVEFRAGAVPEVVRSTMVANSFYWVTTPETELFPSEEIATLQTSTFHVAQEIYDRLVASPIPACTGVHLEQKLDMVKSHPDIPMPTVVDAHLSAGRGAKDRVACSQDA